MDKEVSVEKEAALVVPIQITVTKTHKDSEAAFYSGPIGKSILEAMK